MQGVIFIDGTCFKPGPVTWNRSGWAILKLSEDGGVLAWARGLTGKLLPATSNASENVSVLAAASFPRVTETRSDYKALEAIEVQPMSRVLSRTSHYSGVRRLIRGLAPDRFTVTHVPGHASPDDAADAEERFNALGNNAVDLVAKGSVDRAARPSDSDVTDWHKEVDFLVFF